MTKLKLYSEPRPANLLVSFVQQFLEFRFVERAVQFITVSIDQAILGWMGSVRINNRKQLFCLVRHVEFVEV